MMLTTKGRYAVMALVDIAGKSRFIEGKKAISLAEVAESQNIPLAYLEQIFCKLKNAGIVRSQRGPGGGYVINKCAEELSVAEIINAAEEEIKMTRCGGEIKSPCMTGKGKCSTHDLWDGLSETIDNYLESITLADVVNKRVGARVESRVMSEKVTSDTQQSSIN